MQNATHQGERTHAPPPTAPDGTARDERVSHEHEHEHERNGSGRRSMGHLFANLWRDTTLLVQQEAALAKADVSDKLNQIMAGSGAVIGGVAIVFVGMIALMHAAINALLPYLPPEQALWLSPLIIGIAVVVLGFILFAHGRSELRARNLTPSRSVESLRRDSRLVKEHLQ